MPQKICQLCTVDFTLYHLLHPLMRAMRSQGHEVVGVCADGELIEPVRNDGFRVETMPLTRSANPARNWRAGLALRDFFRREKFDIVHVHTPVAAFVGRLAAARARVPRIAYTAHGFYFHENMPAPRRQAHIAAEWFAGRFTHTLMTQSEEDAQTARRLRLCRTGDILAIGNGSDPDVFKPSDAPAVRSATRAAIGTPDDRQVVLMAGRLVAEKGYGELVTAMRDVDAELWAVGARLSSDHAAGISDTIREIEADPALRDRIRFLGYRDDMADLMRAADIFTLPSHREGMPRSIIEAMLTGLPVVATDVRGSREEVVDGETGLLVPVRDAPALAHALQSLVQDPARRHAMGAAGLERGRRLYDERLVIDRQLRHLGLRTT
ncbi:MAG: glycosyltransferase family 4 protein [Rhodospirillaceae bacterium]|jgi:glycosyltransferase involved in cell wall biosynthesis|nr:glycosyltransferase family 4 protein [Rhodospirillaceae bacterium]MBT4907694.1 glycosyltransferase family 4 protein [Rhodospirillaceae bacterium]MBT5946009.1 glycosyltransferase family 4 protein [Rhodospirillaceae bacterium]MBT6405285.1 glycosyltransferase family 4 protein [Rhodospirillaceae bacterium]MBT6535534.1 glycosyltransferase family 4 protein [Rhodospirillaceae bacterium]